MSPQGRQASKSRMVSTPRAAEWQAHSDILQRVLPTVPAFLKSRLLHHSESPGRGRRPQFTCRSEAIELTLADTEGCRWVTISQVMGFTEAFSSLLCSTGSLPHLSAYLSFQLLPFLPPQYPHPLSSPTNSITLPFLSLRDPFILLSSFMPYITKRMCTCVHTPIQKLNSTIIL